MIKYKSFFIDMIQTLFKLTIKKFFIRLMLRHSLTNKMHVFSFIEIQCIFKFGGGGGVRIVFTPCC